MKMTKFLSVAILVGLLFIGRGLFAQEKKMMKKEGVKMIKEDKMMKQETKMVGGAEMYPTKNIIENAVNSKDHTTLERQ